MGIWNGGLALSKISYEAGGRDGQNVSDVKTREESYRTILNHYTPMNGKIICVGRLTFSQNDGSKASSYFSALMLRHAVFMIFKEANFEEGMPIIYLFSICEVTVGLTMFDSSHLFTVLLFGSFTSCDWADLAQVPKRRCMLPMSVWAVAWLTEFPKMYPLMNYITLYSSYMCYGKS